MRKANWSGNHLPTRKFVTLAHIPVACSSQMQTTTTTTIFKIVLMLEAMGMYRLIKCNPTPTTINTNTMYRIGIFLLPTASKSRPLANCSRGKRALRAAVENCERSGDRRPSDDPAPSVFPQGQELFDASPYCHVRRGPALRGWALECLLVGV